MLADDGEHGLRNALRVLFRERPALPERGQLLGEERVRVGDGLVEGAWEPLLERVAVVRAEDAAEEGVDGSFAVARAVALDGGFDVLADECRLQLVCGAGRAASIETTAWTASGASKVSWSAIGTLEE